MKHYCKATSTDYFEVEDPRHKEETDISLTTHENGGLSTTVHTPEHAKQIARDIDAHADKIIAARPSPRYQEGGREIEAIIDMDCAGCVIARAPFPDKRKLIIDALNAYDKETK